MATQVKTGLIANDAITDAKIANVALTGVTASSGDSSTSLATTAFVATEINSLIDSAPGALNTLNELAAAMGDDANFSTTVTNSIATKLPLAGGAITGSITFDNNVQAIKIKDAAGTAGYVLYQDNGDTLVVGNNTTVEKVRLDTSGNEGALLVDTNGNVGIGTSAPHSKLHLVETASAAAGVDFPLTISSDRYQADYGVGIAFRPENQATGYKVKTALLASGGGYGYNQADLHFCLNASNTVTDEVSLSDAKMTIKKSGNVGIGTDTPAQTLDVKGRVQLTRPVASGHASEGNWDFNISHEDAARYGTLYITPSVSTAEISLMSNKFRFTNTGRLGIGEAVPDYMLHVKNTNTQIAIESTAANQNSSLYYIANGANQWETGVNITAGLDYEIYDRVNNGARLVVQHDGKIRIGNNVPMWSGSYGGGLFLKGNNSTSDRYARLAIVDSTGAETASGSLTLNNNGSVEITRSVNGSGSTSYENILKISRTGGATSNAQREAAISFFDSANSTYTAMITGVRESPAGNYNGGLSIYTNSHSQNGNATSISEMTTGKVVHFSHSQSSEFFGDVYVSGANNRISQNGVAREAKGGYVNGNSTVSYTINHTNQSTFHIRCGFNHYGFLSYGCALDQVFANGSGGMSSLTALINHTTSLGGSWSVTRVDSENITITKNAGSYAGGGYYYIIVEGAIL